MCGITGWIDFKQPLHQQESILRKMTDTLKHRGPDDQNIWLSSHAAFGHRRLIVVDPKGGAQPMQRNDRNGTYTLVYNGELYNTEELRSKLIEKGHAFTGHSDTEVLLASYIEWKEKCVEKLNGIYAFAVWDDLKQQLFAARDRLGVKPFFFSIKDSRLLFGSEPKAILAHPDAFPVIDREGLLEILALGPSKTPGAGIYKGMRELKPGHTLTFNHHGLKETSYWELSSERHSHSLNETVERIRELVKDAITRQTFADLPVGTFLSGGLDSSAISAISSQAYSDRTGRKLNTYSIDYEGNETHFISSVFQPNADQEYIDEVSAYLNTSHRDYIISTPVLVEHLKEAIHFRDMPGYADIDASLLWFCKQLKKDVTVALSGECADEIFGGYPWFHNPETASKEGFPWIRSMTDRQNLLNDQWGNRLNLADYAQQRFAETIERTPLDPSESANEKARRQMFYLNQHWFMAALLERKDRMSMGASLEVRVPFADHRLVEYVWNVPWEMKRLNEREKGLLREAMKGFLPARIIERKKSPYPKTFNPLYTQMAGDWLKESISHSSAPILELFSKEKLKTLIDTNGESFLTPWYGQLMKGPQLLAHLAQLNQWLEDYRIRFDER